MYIIENFPESTAAEIYLASADELLNGVETYASARGYYTYIYNPGRAGWQTVALIGPEIGEEEPEPEPVVQEYYASWEAPAQTTSGSFDFSYGICTDKIQLKTQEKVDSATIEIGSHHQIRQHRRRQLVYQSCWKANGDHQRSYRR